MIRYSACGSTVGELIEALKCADQNEIVKIYDPDADGYYPITGFTYNNGYVELYCDSDDEDEDESIGMEVMEFPNQQSNQVNLYKEIGKDIKMINTCLPMIGAKFKEAVLDKGRCCWETLSIHALLRMLQDHQHKFFIRGMNNRRDAADLACISMMILSKCTEGEFKYIDGIQLPPQPFQTSCPYGMDNADEKFDEECDAFLRKMYRGEEELSFQAPFDQKILDRTKIRTARKRDRSGWFTIKGEKFKAEYEITMTQAAFVSLFDNGFYTPEQFGFDSSVVMWDYYADYYKTGDLVYVHKIISIGVDVGLEDQSS